MRTYYLCAEIYQRGSSKPFPTCSVFLSDRKDYALSESHALIRTIEALSFSDACKLCPEHGSLLSREKIYAMLSPGEARKMKEFPYVV